MLMLMFVPTSQCTTSYYGGSAHFGVHPWHWYFSQGLVSVMTVHLLPVILGLFTHCALRPTLSLAYIAVWYVVFHSFLPHKEHRFLLPIIPFLCLYAGHFLAVSYKGAWNKSSFLFKISFLLMLVVSFLLMLVVNVPLSLYTSMVHQVGPMAAAMSISSQHPAPNLSIVQLMPCYSMPQHSYFHGHNVSIRSLDCSPNLLSDPLFIDEADHFHDDPKSFLKNFWPSFGYVSHVVIYEKTFSKVADFLSSRGFRICDRLFHAHFPTSSRQDNYLLVLCNM
uniref:Mannosyltransferase n=1 Tax=Steinernema glaseri TaxID=37863 RepID=A0A1I7YSV4_9BILA